MDSRGPALLLIVVGVVLVVVGALAWGGWLHFFGRLPGDVRFESEHTRVYFPWVSCLVISAVLSLLLAIVRRFF